MKKIQSVGVYCSSYPNLDKVYLEAAHELGRTLADHHITMIYGGGAQGLMGEVANAVMDHGGRVIGFMPHHLKEYEEPNSHITEMHFVDTMHARKQAMFEHADAFLILPGGFGTLDETFEMITWSQLKLHKKPIVFININNYWDPLEVLTKNIFQQKFALSEHRHCFKFVKTVVEALQGLSQTLELEAPPSEVGWV